MDSATAGGGPGRRAPHEKFFEIILAVAIVVSLVTLGIVALSLVPLGSRPVTTYSSRGGPVTIGATCTHYTDAQVTITATGPGTVVVRATVGVGLNHTFGLRDEARIVIARTDNDCALTNHTAFVSVPPSLPTDPFHFATVPLLRAFSVSARADLTFYVNGIMFAGGDASDRFDSASIVATFYPS